MSKVAILSDVHGNLRALRAVLREVDSLGVEVLAVAGDIIGYGAHPGECIELVQDLGALAVLGNYESYADRAEQRGLAHAEPEEAAGPVAALVRTVRNLSPEQMQWIRQLRLTEVLAPNAVMAHATLHEPEKWHYLHHARNAQPTLDLMKAQGLELGFFGHIRVLQRSQYR